MLFIVGILVASTRSYASAIEGLNTLKAELQLSADQMASAQLLIDNYEQQVAALTGDGQVLRDQMNRMDLGTLVDSDAVEFGNQTAASTAAHTRWVIEAQLGFYRLLDSSRQQQYTALRRRWADEGSAPDLPLGNWPVLCTYEFLDCEPGVIAPPPDPEPEPDPAPESFTVSAGVEQVIAFADGSGSLTFSEHALTDTLDLEVGQSSQYSAEELRSVAFLLGPLTQDLHSPSALSLAVPASAGPNDRLVVARFEDGNWRPLLSSVRENDRVVASITELGIYGVIALPAPVVARQVGPACDAGTQEQDLRFLHVADLHARYGSEEQLYPRLKQYHRDVLLESPYTLFTNGGDDFEKGSVAEQLSAGAATVEATQALGFDVRVIGNHEFAWGSDQLLAHSQDPVAQVLSSNTLYRGDQVGYAGRDFVVLQVGCLKVGFFGMTSVPWNELDEQEKHDPIPNFLPDVEMNWHWEQIAKGAVYQYADQVDVLVMLSHLGVGKDTRILEANADIDVALGGHTHGGIENIVTANGNLVVQPDFYGDGLTDIRLRYSLASKTLSIDNVANIDTKDIDGVDEEVAAAIDDIMARYAPEADVEIAIAETSPTEAEVASLAARAALYHHNADAVMALPDTVTGEWSAGTLTQEHFMRAITVERQPADTPGFTGFYAITVTMAELEAMLAAQPDWPSALKEGVVEGEALTLVLQKGPALNLPLFFPTIADREAHFLSEAWESLEAYGRYRTAQCQHIDTDTRLFGCDPDTLTTVWQFNDGAMPLTPDYGPSRLAYYSPSGGNGSENDTAFGTTDELGIPAVPGGTATVMAFGDYSPDEGLELITNVPANGDYAALGKLSDYTLVFDILWPQESDFAWRGVLQTSPTNANDGDIFFRNRAAGGVGISTSGSSYYGAFEPDVWHRVALVFTAGEQGSFKVFHNGVLIGTKRAGDITERWALSPTALLFTDNSYETQIGYLNALLFSGRAFRDSEIEALGGVSTLLAPDTNTTTATTRVQQHSGQ